MSLIPCFFVWLLPSRAQVGLVQQALMYLCLQDAEDPPTDPAKLVEEYEKLDPGQIAHFKIEKPTGEARQVEPTQV